MNPVGSLGQMSWVGFVNNNAGTVPPFGVMRVTGISIVEAGRVVLTCDQPNSYGDLANCVINGPVNVASGAYGSCTRAWMTLALYDNGNSPSLGQMWGPVNGSWKLTKNSIGWLAQGSPTNSGNSLALFSPVIVDSVRGTIASDAAPDSNSTLTVNVGAYGSESATAFTISNVRNASDCTLKSGSGAKIHRATYDWAVPGWEFDVGRTA